MNISSKPLPASLISPRGGGAHNSAEAGMLLMRVFELFDTHDVRYCVLHGYEGYPHHIKSDVDCVIGADTPPAEILRLLQRNCSRIGANVVRCDGTHIVLAAPERPGHPCILTLDLMSHNEVDGLRFHSGAELLQARRRRDQYWIPSPELAFGSYLVRSIAKGVLDEERGHKLRQLYGQSPAGCEPQVARFWPPEDASVIVECARTGDWSAAIGRLQYLRARLRRRSFLRHPLHLAGHVMRGMARRVGRVLRPEGLHVVFLGPDGAGKSSVIDAVSSQLADVFPRSTCLGFAPALLHVLRQRRERRTDQPHALAARSLITSLLRAGYWFAYYTLGYLRLHIMLARSTLVLNDRHFVDVLVDPKRYRYGGPMWLVRLIWRIIPKPDLIILLDAPPEVLQSRKQEVPFDVTAQQRAAYVALVQQVDNGKIVNADQPRASVSADVASIILQILVKRSELRIQRGDKPADRVSFSPAGTAQ